MAKYPKIVDLPTICGILMLERKRLSQLAESGHVRKLAPGQYDLFESVRGYIRFLRDEHKLRNKTTADARVREARAREIEARTAERLKQLVSVSVMEEIIDGLCGLVRSEFAGLAAASTRDLTQRRIIDRGVNERLRRLAEYAMARAIRLEAGGSSADAKRSNGAGSMGGGE